MSLHRCFIPSEHVRGGTIILDDPQELHHLQRVLRLSVGDRLVCVDQDGTEYTGAISAQTPQAVTVRIEQRRAPARAGVELWIGLAALKADRFDLAVQKATELGVRRLTPLITDRTIVRPTSGQAGPRLARWQRIAREAAKQSARADVPQIDAPYLFREFLPLIASSSLVMIPTLAVPSASLWQVLTAFRRHSEAGADARRDAARVVALIGPEGDFTGEEVRLAQDHGAVPVSLGRRPLRSETAALAVLAVLSYTLEAS